ncbi:MULTISPECIES: SAM-dependent methyltransferase [unclassified Micromonospora]|uniref:SAM-dependent methyltransferase n=1 Tax=unclassified Micromonospora TaxID=2617518 RepID=UPI003A8630DC
MESVATETPRSWLTPPDGQRSPAEMFDQFFAMQDEFNDGQCHQGYWYDEQDRTSMIEASRRLTRKAADSLRLRPGERLLDVGCGLGAPAIQLASEYGVRVTGVNFSVGQIAEAQARAEKAGLTGQVSFRSINFSALDFTDGSFDAMVAMESLVYVNDLVEALRGLHRVLRPGGRLAVTEPTREGLGVVAAGRFATRSGANYLLSVPEWLDALREAGFELVEYLQCGSRVVGMGPRYLEDLDSRRDELVARFGPARVDEHRRAMASYFVEAADRIGYAVITVRKP